MTAPTREQVEEWVRDAGLDWHKGFISDDCPLNRYEALISIAFAAGQCSGDGSGAELVREVEESAKTNDTWGDGLRLVLPDYWPRLRTALISGDAAREDVERLATAHESVLRSLKKKAPRFEDTDRLDMIETKSWCVGKYESNRFYVHLGQINGKQCETTGATLREAIDRARGGGDA